MELYAINKNQLAAIEKDPFKLEKDIQSLVESNLETLFELTFVSTEFTVGSFRLDSLAFDEENKSFVIIEYKKGSSYSVVDQGYSYLSVMVNNKADFILEYNEKMGVQLKRDEIDWSNSRVIFVAPSFNTYQKNSINFQDVPFELWEINRYENDIISLNRWMASSSEKISSVTKPNTNKLISKVATEIKVHTEQDHVNKLSASMKPVWLSLKERLAVFAETTFPVQKQYVSWKKENKNVCFIHFRKNDLFIEIVRGNKNPAGEHSKGFFNIDDPKNIVKEYNWTWKSGATGHRYAVSVKQEEDLDYLLFLLEQKYKDLG